MPKTLFWTFTQEQSQAIVASVKSNIGNNCTITHLAIAAVMLALVKTNPPRGDNAPNIYVTPSSINGRQWMKEPYSSGKVPYLANAQANGVVAFENLKDYVQAPGQESVEKTRKLLVRAATAAKAEYARCLNRPNQLAISIPTMEMFAALFFRYLDFALTTSRTR